MYYCMWLVNEGLFCRIKVMNMIFDLYIFCLVIYKINIMYLYIVIKDWCI